MKYQINNCRRKFEKFTCLQCFLEACFLSRINACDITKCIFPPQKLWLEIESWYSNRHSVDIKPSKCAVAFVFYCVLYVAAPIPPQGAFSSWDGRRLTPSRAPLWQVTNKIKRMAKAKDKSSLPVNLCTLVFIIQFARNSVDLEVHNHVLKVKISFDQWSTWCTKNDLWFFTINLYYAEIKKKYK